MANAATAISEVKRLVYSIGERVRVFQLKEECSATATISFIHESDDYFETYCDVIYDASRNDDSSTATTSTRDEENMVDIKRIRPLEEFEYIPHAKLLLQTDASTMKEFGNILFRHKDYRNSIIYYELGLERLFLDTNKSEAGSKAESGLKTFSIGTQVIVFSKDINDYDSAMISSNDLVDNPKTQSDIRYEAILSTSQLEIEVKGCDCVEIASIPTNQLLQRTLYINLTKAYQKRNYRGWAVRYASYAVVLSKIHCGDYADSRGSCGLTETEMKQLLADSLFLRGKVYLSASRPARAKLVRF
jgi:hypothetical protein